MCLDEQVNACFRVAQLKQGCEREVVLALVRCPVTLDNEPMGSVIHVDAPACAASFVSPSRSPTARSSSINAFKSPAFSKLSRARSNRHTASARSPIAFHFVSASSSGTVRAISTAASRSSNCKERSNFWSGSVVTSRASSLSPTNRGEHRDRGDFVSNLTSAFQERRDLVPMIFRDGRENFRRGIHVSPEDRGLVLNHTER